MDFSQMLKDIRSGLNISQEQLIGGKMVRTAQICLQRRHSMTFARKKGLNKK